MAKLLTLLLLLTSLHTSAQKIYGTIFDDKGDLLPYSSITIKGTSIGASANNKAKFSFTVAPGTYVLVCQHIGYTKQEKTVQVSNTDEEVSFIITAQKLDMAEVLVKSGGEDLAYGIIRNAIKKRSYYNKQINGFDCDLYTKDIMRLRNLPKRVLGQKIPDADRQKMSLDTSGKGVIYLAESVAKIYIQQPDKFKMNVISSRVSGSSSFGFTFPTFINLYNNNVTIFTERFNPRGFVSPIADNALSLYKYKFLGSFNEDGKEVNSIRVMPRRTYEPLFSGIINITDDDWRIHSIDLTLTKTAQLEILDTLHITQIHVPVGNDVWRVKNQLLYFNFKQFGIDAIGNFVNVYSNYNIDPIFAKGIFDRTIIKYDTAVNKRSKEYWDTVRPVPLEPEEKKDYQVKDSIYKIRQDSAWSKRTIDSLRSRQGKLKLYKLFWNGIDRTHYSRTNTYRWGIEPFIPLLEYNPAEGLVTNVVGYYEKDLTRSKTRLSIQPTVRYGFNNTHLNAWLDVSLRTRDWAIDKKIKRQSWTFSGGKRVSQFNKESTITALSNSVNVLFWGDNFMKTYENYFGSITFSKRYESGLRFSINALYEDRIPLNNTTTFTLFKKKSVNITPNYPYEKIDAQFAPHQAFIMSFDISIKPGQRYIEFPNNKTAIGSKYPTFSFNYTKGFKVFGSDVDLDRWKLTINNEKNLKLAGTFKYRVGIGGFLNSKAVPIQDQQHFNGNRSTVASEYVNSFQLAKYYANSSIAAFYSIGHVEHHFNGLLTNKIPLFKRLNWNLVAGTNAFYVNKDNNYVELFAGIENIFKIFRVDVVAAYENGKVGRTGVRIGADGLIGSSVKRQRSTGAGRRNSSININF